MSEGRLASERTRDVFLRRGLECATSAAEFGEACELAAWFWEDRGKRSHLWREGGRWFHGVQLRGWQGWPKPRLVG